MNKQNMCDEYGYIYNVLAQIDREDTLTWTTKSGAVR